MIAAKTNQLYWRLFLFTRKQLLSAIAIFGGSLLMVVLAIIPQITAINATNAKLAKERQELTKIVGKYQELESVKLSPEFAESDRIDAILPSKKPLLELMTALNTVAAGTSVAVTELSINPGEIATTSAQLKQTTRQQKTAYDHIDVALTVVGKLDNIQQFMSTIEQISPITTITRISLSQSTTSTTGVTLTTAQLMLQTNYFTQQIQTTLTATLPKISAREKEIFQTIQSFTPPEAENGTNVEGGGLADPFAVEKLPN